MVPVRRNSGDPIIYEIYKVLNYITLDVRQLSMHDCSYKYIIFTDVPLTRISFRSPP